MDAAAAAAAAGAAVVVMCAPKPTEPTRGHPTHNTDRIGQANLAGRDYATGESTNANYMSLQRLVRIEEPTLGAVQAVALG